MRKLFSFLIIFVILAAFVKVPTVSAGTNISVSCNLTTCTATPESTPLFNESNIWPGYSVTQQITATNTTNQNGQLGLDANEQVSDNEDSFQALATDSLANKILIEIHKGTANGPIVYGGGSTTLQNLYDAGQVALGLIGPTQQGKYFLKATLDPQIGNEHMAANTAFDFTAGFEFTPIQPTNSPQVQGTNNSSGGTGGTSGVTTPVCKDRTPTGFPVLTATAVGGQVNLQWTAVQGASHYAINFGTQPGIYIYGNNNVGNVTTYTVSGLTSGTQYFFQVLGINGCAPGRRSNEATTAGRLLPASTQVGRPAGFSPDQVLGVTEDASGEADQANQEGAVLGDATCAPWKRFLPLILLAIQFVVSLVIYVIYRNPGNRLKHVSALIADIALTALFYYLRNCDCSQVSFLSLLCKWYIIAAIAMALVTQFVNYALIEREE